MERDVCRSIETHESQDRDPWFPSKSLRLYGQEPNKQESRWGAGRDEMKYRVPPTGRQTQRIRGYDQPKTDLNKPVTLHDRSLTFHLSFLFGPLKRDGERRNLL